MNTKLEFTVGAFILMGFACALALAFASTNSADRLAGDSYLVSARFTNVGELRSHAPVKIAGVRIGEVESIALDPTTFESIVRFRLSRVAGELPADTSAGIYTAGLLGDRYLGLSPGGELDALDDGDEIVLTQSAVVLEELIGKYMFGSADGDDSEEAAADPAPAELNEPAPAQEPAADMPVPADSAGA